MDDVDANTGLIDTSVITEPDPNVIDVILKVATDTGNPLDLNNDGKVDKEDLKIVIKKVKEGDWRTLLGIVFALIVFFTKNNIVLLIADGSGMAWVDFIFNSILAGLFVAFINYISQATNKKVDQEKKKCKEANKLLNEEIEKNSILKIDIEKLKSSKELEIQTVRAEHRIAMVQVEGALDAKNQYIDLLKNGAIDITALPKE